MCDRLAALYPQHLDHVKARATHALARSGHDLLLVAAGTQTYRFLDDTPNPYYPNPQFKWWLPLTRHPDCWIAYAPGSKPVLVYVQPADYWHVPLQDPGGYWVEHFDIRVVVDVAQVRAQLPRDLSRAAIVAEPSAAIEGVAPNNPRALLDSLHLSRTRKTGYELECLRRASLKAAIAHRAAGAAFRERRSEYEIHLAYCEAARAHRARTALWQHRRAQRARRHPALPASGPRAPRAAPLAADRCRRPVQPLRRRRHPHLRPRQCGVHRAARDAQPGATGAVRPVQRRTWTRNLRGMYVARQL